MTNIFVLMGKKLRSILEGTHVNYAGVPVTAELTVDTHN